MDNLTKSLPRRFTQILPGINPVKSLHFIQILSIVLVTFPYYAGINYAHCICLPIMLKIMLA